MANKELSAEEKLTECYNNLLHNHNVFAQNGNTLAMYHAAVDMLIIDTLRRQERQLKFFFSELEKFKNEL